MSDSPQNAAVAQPVTDDSLRVRQLNHYQFSWVAGQPGQDGAFTLQLVLDQGASEEVVTVNGSDARVLQALLAASHTVMYDIDRHVLMFGTTPTGTA